MIGNVKKSIAAMTLADVGPGVTLDHAVAELVRELEVRRRIYDRWIKDGKLSFIDAKDRIERQMYAAYVLQELASKPVLLDAVLAPERVKPDLKGLEPESEGTESLPEAEEKVPGNLLDMRRAVA